MSPEMLHKSRLIAHIVRFLPLSAWSGEDGLMTDPFLEALIAQGTGPTYSKNLLEEEHMNAAVQRAQGLVRLVLGEDSVFAYQDETPLWNGRGAVAMVFATWQHEVVADLVILEEGETMDHQRVISLTESAIARLAVPPERLLGLGGDNVAYNGLAYETMLQKYPKLSRQQCIPHTLNLAVQQLAGGKPPDHLTHFQEAFALVDGLRKYLVPTKGLEDTGRYSRFVAATNLHPRYVSAFSFFSRSYIYIYVSKVCVALIDRRSEIDFLPTRWGTYCKAAAWIIEHAGPISCYLIAEQVRRLRYTTPYITVQKLIAELAASPQAKQQEKAGKRLKKLRELGDFVKVHCWLQCAAVAALSDRALALLKVAQTSNAEVFADKHLSELKQWHARLHNPKRSVLRAFLIDNLQLASRGESPSLKFMELSQNLLDRTVTDMVQCCDAAYEVFEKHSPGAIANFAALAALHPLLKYEDDPAFPFEAVDRRWLPEGRAPELQAEWEKLADFIYRMSAEERLALQSSSSPRLDFWGEAGRSQSFPLLSGVVKRLLCLRTGIAGVERLFNRFPFFCQPSRRAMDMTQLARHFFLALNSPYIDFFSAKYHFAE